MTSIHDPCRRDEVELLHWLTPHGAQIDSYLSPIRVLLTSLGRCKLELTLYRPMEGTWFVYSSEHLLSDLPVLFGAWESGPEEAIQEIFNVAPPEAYVPSPFAPQITHAARTLEDLDL